MNSFASISCFILCFNFKSIPFRLVSIHKLSVFSEQMQINDFGSEKTLNGKEFNVFRDCKFSEMKLKFVCSILFLVIYIKIWKAFRIKHNFGEKNIILVGSILNSELLNQPIYRINGAHRL